MLNAVIDHINTGRRTANYANFLPIIQSPGTGKSRTVDKLARRVFTLPFNLRLATDHTGYPKGDLGILEWLSVKSSDTLFKVVHEKLTDALSFNSQEELAE
ncbi:hypothetical protein FRC10_010072 [Ceratobasidium sp. 414]|nr:hypothetical protein FRC10_010072 [Ceratobasidium sp. 414]